MEEKKKKKESKLSLKQFLCYLVSDDMTQISDIITKLRAVRGVVTISIFEPTKKYAKNKHLTKIKLKYLMFSQNLKENIKMLKKSILSVDGVYSVVLKIKRTDLQSGDASNLTPQQKPKDPNETIQKNQE
jgi:hypothetical protein